MPVMSKIEAAFCRSAPWRGFTTTVVMPWVLRGQDLTGDVLEIGAGAGANTAVLARTQPAATITATDIDPAMVTAARQRVARFGARVIVEEADTHRSSLRRRQLRHGRQPPHAPPRRRLGIRPRRARPRTATRRRLLGYDLTATRGARTIHLADRSPHQLLDPAQLRAGLAAAGFADIDVTAGLVARFHATVPTPPQENQP